MYQSSSLPDRADRAAAPLQAAANSSAPPSLQRQDSGPRSIKGILKKSRSTSVESDHSEGSVPETAPSKQSSVASSHPESEVGEGEREREEEMEEEEEDMEEEEAGQDEDSADSTSFGLSRQRTGGGSGSSSRSSRGSSEEMRSPSPDESLGQTSTQSEDVEELESSLDGSQGSSLQHRSAQHQEVGANFFNLTRENVNVGSNTGGPLVTLTSVILKLQICFIRTKLKFPSSKCLT